MSKNNYNSNNYCCNNNFKIFDFLEAFIEVLMKDKNLTERLNMLF